jgi:hypothetical protein
VTLQAADLMAFHRALAKHAQRSSDGWWGTAKGSDDKKNSDAMRVSAFMMAWPGCTVKLSEKHVIMLSTHTL